MLVMEYKCVLEKATISSTEGLMQHAQRILDTHGRVLSVLDLQMLRNLSTGENISVHSFRSLLGVHRQLQLNVSIAELLSESTGVSFAKKPKPKVSCAFYWFIG